MTASDKSKPLARAQVAAHETTMTGKGMPARKPRSDPDRVGRAPSPQDAAIELSLSLPHERDQSIDMTPETPSPRMKQAQQDEMSQRQDTSKALEMNQAYQKQK